MTRPTVYPPHTESLPAYAARHGVSRARAWAWARVGRIDGAVLCGARWRVPVGAGRPAESSARRGKGRGK